MEERFVTTTVAVPAPASMVDGLTSRPDVALTETSPDRLARLTVNEPEEPVPSMDRLSTDGDREAGAGA